MLSRKPKLSDQKFFYSQDPFLSNHEPPDKGFMSHISGLKETEDALLGWIDHYRLDAKKIDVTSRVLFPLSFILFTLSYWLYYANTEENIDYH